MFRLFRNSVELIIMSLLHYKDLGYNTGDTKVHGKKYYSGNKSITAKSEIKEAAKFIMNVERNRRTPQDDEDEDIDEILTILSRQLLDEVLERGKNQDRDLVQLVVETLELPSASNRLRGDAIARLRRSILLPNELAVVRNKLNVVGCAGCKHVFVDGEMVVAEKTRENISFFCARCLRPFMAVCGCDGCEEALRMSEEVRDALVDKMPKCEAHGGPRGERLPEINVGQVRAFVGGRRANVRMPRPTILDENGFATTVPATATAAGRIDMNWDPAPIPPPQVEYQPILPQQPLGQPATTGWEVIPVEQPDFIAQDQTAYRIAVADENDNPFDDPAPRRFNP